MSAHSKDRYVINSILRACNILRCFLGEKTLFKISELARELGLDRSTTYRILLSLEKWGSWKKITEQENTNLEWLPLRSETAT